jgi:hypothetical protein
MISRVRLQLVNMSEVDVNKWACINTGWYVVKLECEGGLGSFLVLAMGHKEADTLLLAITMSTNQEKKSDAECGRVNGWNN